MKKRRKQPSTRTRLQRARQALHALVFNARAEVDKYDLWHCISVLEAAAIDHGRRLEWMYVRKRPGAGAP